MNTWEKNRDCLIFDLTGKLYGVAVPLVQEIVRLPEITPMEDAPSFIVGVMNLRGRVVPVLDLNIRLGRLPQPVYHLSDAVVVLEWRGVFMGIIINDVREVRRLGPEEIDSVPAFEESDIRRHRHVLGVARVEEELVMLLDPEHLLHILPVECLPDDEGEEKDKEKEKEKEPPLELPLTEQRRFNAGASEAERTVFRERARRLMNTLEAREVSALEAMAVVQLHGESLAVGLNCVRGFARLRQVTPVPCCPDHIVGGMNLRGSILTLVDITRVLGLTSQPDRAPTHIMVAEVNSLTVGVLVNDVVDVIHLRTGEIAKAPTAAGSLRKEHLKGAAHYGEGMLGILNLETILTNQSLQVSEEV